MSMIKLNGCFCSVLRVCELGEGARKLRNLFLRGMEHTRSIIHSFSCLSFDRNGEKFLRRRAPTEILPVVLNRLLVVLFFCLPKTTSCDVQKNKFLERIQERTRKDEEIKIWMGKSETGCWCFDGCFECFAQCFNVLRHSPRLEQAKQQLSH